MCCACVPVCVCVPLKHLSAFSYNFKAIGPHLTLICICRSVRCPICCASFWYFLQYLTVLLLFVVFPPTLKKQPLQFHLVFLKYSFSNLTFINTEESLDIYRIYTSISDYSIYCYIQHSFCIIHVFVIAYFIPYSKTIKKS